LRVDEAVASIRPEVAAIGCMLGLDNPHDERASPAIDWRRRAGFDDSQARRAVVRTGGTT
jgi:hypothetical protein